MDEIKRCTSTYDGISITAIVEHLHNNPQLYKPSFATHYHELNQLV
jgi:DNA mismatch repair ATPase MutS